MSIALLPLIERFLEKSWDERGSAIRWHAKRLWNRTKLNFPVVKRMEPGFLWIAWDDVVREAVLSGNFERAERNFVERFLKPGMTVLDIGAYYGLYTLTASVKVGPSGRVIAFEPAPFQRKRLKWHLWLNRYKNVRVENVALGGSEGEQTLFSINGGSAGYASLRNPEVSATLNPIPVQVTTLDTYLRTHQFTDVDFMKIDIEGGELDLFRGAIQLFRCKPRPVILCELEDVRTKTWGHGARDTAAFLEGFGYAWFRTLEDGSLAPPSDILEVRDRNLVAVPEERRDQLKELMRDASRS